MKSLRCTNRHCLQSGNNVALIRHGFHRTRWGKRRRYRCQSCGKTFCSTSGEPYYRLQHRRATFDEVAALSVEGLNKSAIARTKRIAWNTVHRWLERAASWCRGFNNGRIKNLTGPELQADEIQTTVRGKERPLWVFVVVDVWSRLWPSTVVGKRSYRNTLNLFRDLCRRMSLGAVPLITTDGFKFYERVIGLVFGPACVYGPGDQEEKERSSDQHGAKSRNRELGIETSVAEL
jgi:transposase-like protein